MIEFYQISSHFAVSHHIKYFEMIVKLYVTNSTTAGFQSVELNRESF